MMEEQYQFALGYWIFTILAIVTFANYDINTIGLAILPFLSGMYLMGWYKTRKKKK